jgi:hypothetical protein
LSFGNTYLSAKPDLEDGLLKQEKTILLSRNSSCGALDEGVLTKFDLQNGGMCS